MTDILNALFGCVLQLRWGRILQQSDSFFRFLDLMIRKKLLSGTGQNQTPTLGLKLFSLYKNNVRSVRDVAQKIRRDIKTSWNQCLRIITSFGSTSLTAVAYSHTHADHLQQ